VPTRSNLPLRYRLSALPLRECPADVVFPIRVERYEHRNALAILRYSQICSKGHTVVKRDQHVSFFEPSLIRISFYVDVAFL
jgi:hypothetical protein